MKSRLGTLMVAGVCAALGAPAAIASDAGVRWELSTGADYSSGEYGGSVATEILYVPFTARAQGERLKLEVTVPYMRLEGPGNVVGGIDAPIVTNPSNSGVATNSGLGDVNLALSYLLPQLGSGGPFVELKARTKLPTAADGLGTGETDYAAQVDFYQMVGPRFTVIAGVGYQRLGDPDGLELEDGMTGTFGFSAKPSTRTDAGVLYEHRRRSFVGLDDQASVVPFIAWRATQGFGLMLYGVFGTTEASPDYGAGLQFTLYP